MKTAIGICAVVALAGAAHAQVGLVDFDGTELGLTSYTNSAVTGASTSASSTSTSGVTSWGAGDASWPMSRSLLGPNGIGMPFSISDDSVTAATGNTTFTGDVLGFAHAARGGDGFFGVTDVVNAANPSGAASADFRFDISGAGDVKVSIDMAAMGDFEAGGADVFDWFWEIDGSGLSPLFTSSVDDTTSHVYGPMDSGATPSLDDPVFIDGVILDNFFKTFMSGNLGSGSELRLFFSTATDGGTEGYGFDNITVDRIPTPGSIALLSVAGLAGIRRRR
jgi:hypothetical protein